VDQPWGWGVEVIDKIIEDRDPPLVGDLCGVMLNGSLCGLGGLILYPVSSALRHFPQDFGVQRVEELNLQ